MDIRLAGNGRPCPVCQGGRRRASLLVWLGRGRKARPGDYEWRMPAMQHDGFGRWSVCSMCKGLGRVSRPLSQVLLEMRGTYATEKQREDQQGVVEQGILRQAVRRREERQGGRQRQRQDDERQMILPLHLPQE